MAWDREALETDRKAKAMAQANDADLQATGLRFLSHSYEFDYCYQWNWAGFPILQMPEDIVALQEILFSCKPTVVIETGVAWGGGLALVASMMSLYAPNGTVLGIDLNLNPALSEQLAGLNLPVKVDLLQASSVDESALAWVDEHITSDGTVMVILDSHHTHDHVLAELRAYSLRVSPGQFLIVGDTSVKDISTATKRVRPWNADANPHTALEEFLTESSDFIRDPAVNQKLLTTFHPGGYLRRV
jgi:cephalosporin hydroxylase